MTASSWLARRIELKHPGLSNIDKVEVVVQLRATHPALAEGLTRVWDLD